MSKARSRLALRLTSLLGVLVVGLAWWALDTSEAGRAEVQLRPRPNGEVRAPQLSEARSAQPDPRRTIKSEDPSPVESALEEEGVDSEPAWTFLWGIVLEGGQLAPIEDATVYFERGEFTTEAVTDASGQFRVALPPDWALGDAVGVMIAGQGGGIRLGGWFGHGLWSEGPPNAGRCLLFRGVVALQQPLQLIARERLDLQGRLEAGAVEEPASLAVQAFVPPESARSDSMFAGRSPLDEEGYFAIQAWVDSVPDSFFLEFDSHSGRVLNVLVSTKDLTSPGGATIGVAGRWIELAVLSEEGTPIAGASVGIALEGSDELSKCGTDPRGRARLLVAEGAARLCVGAPGRASHYESLKLGAAESGFRTVVLRSLGPDDRVAGKVVDEGGQAIPDAFVAIQPLTHDPRLGDVGHADVRTDGQGRFSLAVAGNGDLRLEAGAGGFGSSESLVVRGGERDVRIVLGACGRVLARFSHSNRASISSSGGVEWILIDARGEKLAAGEDCQSEIELTSIPTGQHELLARAFDPACLARGTVLVKAGQTSILDLRLQAVEQVSGRLIDSAGNPIEGLEVRLVNIDLPAAAAELWGVDRSAVDGRFNLLLGHASRAQLSVREGWQVLLRQFVQGGDLGPVPVPR